MKRAIVLAVFCAGLVGIAMMNGGSSVARVATNPAVSAVDAKKKPIPDLSWLVGGVGLCLVLLGAAASVRWQRRSLAAAQGDGRS